MPISEYLLASLSIAPILSGGCHAVASRFGNQKPDVGIWR